MGLPKNREEELAVIGNTYYAWFKISTEAGMASYRRLRSSPAT
jgi:hypothetical protein